MLFLFVLLNEADVKFFISLCATDIMALLVGHNIFPLWNVLSITKESYGQVPTYIRFLFGQPVL